VRQDFLAVVLWAEGPTVRPAQGNALGNEMILVHLSAQRAKSSPNGSPVGRTLVTLALPIIRTSVAHGTALDIAWIRQAETGSMIEALRVASRLAAARDEKWRIRPLRLAAPDGKRSPTHRLAAASTRCRERSPIRRHFSVIVIAARESPDL
jgi:hypothetical protein